MAQVEQRHREAAEAGLPPAEVVFQGEYQELLEYVAQLIADAESRGAQSRQSEAEQKLERLESALEFLDSNALSYVTDTAEYDLSQDGLLALATDLGWTGKAGT